MYSKKHINMHLSHIATHSKQLIVGYNSFELTLKKPLENSVFNYFAKIVKKTKGNKIIPDFL